MADKKLTQNQEDYMRRAYGEPETTPENKKWLREVLQERMMRNQELGLAPSPEDTTIDFMEPGSKISHGVVQFKDPKKVQISPSLNVGGKEDIAKYTIAHELQHVNQLSNPNFNKNKAHESMDSTVATLNQLGNAQHEKTRLMRSLMHASPGRRKQVYNVNYDKNIPKDRPVGFDLDTVLKYAKEQGVPVDDIIDAMTTNYAVSADKDAREAHNLTKQNQKMNILEKIGLKKPKSTEEIYKPWKDMKEKRKKK
jgi:hypothetical protein